MSVIIIVGAFGSGKSTHLKTEYLSKTKNKKRIYAIEKQDYEGVVCETDFRKMIMESTGVTNTLYVIDEAKTAIPRDEPDPTNPKKPFDKKLIEWFLNSRKYNNFIFIVFHSLRDIPVWLISYVKYIQRFQTGDQMNYMLTRFSSFPQIVKSIQENELTENFVFDEIKLR